MIKPIQIAKLQILGPLRIIPAIWVYKGMNMINIHFFACLGFTRGVGMALDNNSLHSESSSIGLSVEPLDLENLSAKSPGIKWGAKALKLSDFRGMIFTYCTLHTMRSTFPISIHFPHQ